MVGIAMYDAVNAATGLVYGPYSYSGGAVPLASAAAAAYYAGYKRSVPHRDAVDFHALPLSN
jgi:hypothetical protein